MVRSVVRRRLALAALIALASGASVADAHPLHTTLAELTVRPDQHTVELSIRVFADDLMAAAGTRTAPGDSAVRAYVSRHFVLRDRSGRTVPWAWCGQRRTDDLVWVCLRGPIADALAGAELRVDVACAIYTDQVNVVRVVSPRGRRTLLFTCDDARQTLP